jgi:hypothetical protein
MGPLPQAQGAEEPAADAPPRRAATCGWRPWPSLRGELVARCHSHVATETIEFESGQEFGFKIACFEHIWEGYKIARELAAAGIGISVFADSWAYKMEAAEGIAYNAGYCAKKGVLVSINSDSGERIRRLFNDAAKTMKYGGLSEDEALRLVTINPPSSRRRQDRQQPESGSTATWPSSTSIHERLHAAT